MNLTQLSTDPWKESFNPQFVPLPASAQPAPYKPLQERAVELIQQHVERNAAANKVEEEPAPPAPPSLLAPEDRYLPKPRDPSAANGEAEGQEDPSQARPRRPSDGTESYADHHTDGCQTSEGGDEEFQDGMGFYALSPEERDQLAAAWAADEGSDGPGEEGGAPSFSFGAPAQEVVARMRNNNAGGDDEAINYALTDALEPLVSGQEWFHGRPGYRSGSLIYSAANMLDAQGLAKLRAANAHLYEDNVRARILAEADAEAAAAAERKARRKAEEEEHKRRLALLTHKMATHTEEERRTLAAVIIQSYCRGWRARRELAKLKQQAVRAAVAKAAAQALTRERADARRLLRQEAKDCLLALQAQADYERTRARLMAAKGMVATLAAPPPPPQVRHELWSRVQALGLDPIKLLLDAGMRPGQVEAVMRLSALELPQLAEHTAAHMAPLKDYDPAAAAAASAAGEHCQQVGEPASSGSAGGAPSSLSSSSSAAAAAGDQSRVVGARVSASGASSRATASKSVGAAPGSGRAPSARASGSGSAGNNNSSSSAAASAGYNNASSSSTSSLPAGRRSARPSSDGGHGVLERHAMPMSTAAFGLSGLSNAMSVQGGGGGGGCSAGNPAAPAARTSFSGAALNSNPSRTSTPGSARVSHSGMTNSAVGDSSSLLVSGGQQALPSSALDLPAGAAGMARGASARRQRQLSDAGGVMHAAAAGNTDSTSASASLDPAAALGLRVVARPLSTRPGAAANSSGVGSGTASPNTAGSAPGSPMLAPRQPAAPSQQMVQHHLRRPAGAIGSGHGSPGASFTAGTSNNHVSGQPSAGLSHLHPPAAAGAGGSGGGAGGAGLGSSTPGAGGYSMVTMQLAGGMGNAYAGNSGAAAVWTSTHLGVNTTAANANTVRPQSRSRTRASCPGDTFGGAVSAPTSPTVYAAAMGGSGGGGGGAMLYSSTTSAAGPVFAYPPGAQAPLSPPRYTTGPSPRGSQSGSLPSASTTISGGGGTFTSLAMPGGSSAAVGVGGGAGPRARRASVSGPMGPYPPAAGGAASAAAGAQSGSPRLLQLPSISPSGIIGSSSQQTGGGVGGGSGAPSMLMVMGPGGVQYARVGAPSPSPPVGTAAMRRRSAAEYM